MDEEGLQSTKNNRIFIGKPIEMDYERFERYLSVLDEAAWKEEDDIRKIVQRMVPGYHYQDDGGSAEAEDEAAVAVVE